MLLKAPTQCVLWEKPELIRLPVQERFETLETYVDDGHWLRSLRKCRECGQLYFYEFYEWIDWKDGDDPQYRKWIPVGSPDEIEALNGASPAELMSFRPRLNSDFPKDAKEPRIYWSR